MPRIIEITTDQHRKILHALRSTKLTLLDLADTVGEQEENSHLFNEGGSAFESLMLVEDVLRIIG
jgi:hypothetical protein